MSLTSFNQKFKRSHVSVDTYSFYRSPVASLNLNPPGDGFCGYHALALTIMIGLKANPKFLDGANEAIKNDFVEHFNKAHGTNYAAFNEVTRACCESEDSFPSFLNGLTTTLRAVNGRFQRPRVQEVILSCGASAVEIINHGFSCVIDQRTEDHPSATGHSREYASDNELKTFIIGLGIEDKVKFSVLRNGQLTYRDEDIKDTPFRFNHIGNHWTLSVLPEGPDHPNYYNKACEIIENTPSYNFFQMPLPSLFAPIIQTFQTVVSFIFSLLSSIYRAFFGNNKSDSSFTSGSSSSLNPISSPTRKADTPIPESSTRVEAQADTLESPQEKKSASQLRKRQ